MFIYLYVCDHNKCKYAYRNMYIYTCTKTQVYIAKEYGSSLFHLAVFFHCFSLNQNMALKYERIYVCGRYKMSRN